MTFTINTASDVAKELIKQLDIKQETCDYAAGFVETVIMLAAAKLILANRISLDELVEDIEAAIGLPK